MKNRFYFGLLFGLRHLIHARYQFLFFIVVPFFLFLFFIALFYDGIPYNLPIGVVDHDHSKLSRSFIQSIDATQTLKVAYKLESVDEAQKLLKKGKIYAFVRIEQGLQKRSIVRDTPSVAFYINTQYILIGKAVHAALLKAYMATSLKMEALLKLRKSPSLTLGSDLFPMTFSVIALFNTDQNYGYFLLFALLPSLWQIIVIVGSVIVIGEILKAKKTAYLLRRNPLGFIVGVLAPYSVVFLFYGLFFIFYLYGPLGHSFAGSFWLLLLALFLTMVAYEAVALLFLSVTKDYARSLSLGAVFAAPAFAFVGITFPSLGMNHFALLWRALLPITHYLQIQIAQAHYGSSFFDVAEEYYALATFIPLFFVAVWILWRRR